ncbi:period circadian protein isoform X1 [Hyalella azteca]|uniref:Period circadian protein isoform X1 n=1 Tax=Hyalella azteca TaxID=294128 RepID=A0A8B7PIC8_HYAAZ|nr:period circadian protein isoform X1 [Hyalella azteca]
MGSSGAALLVVALALHGVEAQQLSGVPQLTDDEFSRLSTCVGDRAAQRVNNSIARWSEPCLAVWNSPVWNSRRLEAELTRPWEEVLWQLVFREDLNNIGGTASPVPCVPVSSTSASVPATITSGSATTEAALSTMETTRFTASAVTTRSTSRSPGPGSGDGSGSGAGIGAGGQGGNGTGGGTGGSYGGVDPVTTRTSSTAQTVSTSPTASTATLSTTRTAEISSTTLPISTPSSASSTFSSVTPLITSSASTATTTPVPTSLGTSNTTTQRTTNATNTQRTTTSIRTSTKFTTPPRVNNTGTGGGTGGSYGGTEPNRTNPNSNLTNPNGWWSGWNNGWNTGGGSMGSGSNTAGGWPSIPNSSFPRNPYYGSERPSDYDDTPSLNPTEGKWYWDGNYWHFVPYIPRTGVGIQYPTVLVLPPFPPPPLPRFPIRPSFPFSLNPWLEPPLPSSRIPYPDSIPIFYHAGPMTFNNSLFETNKTMSQNSTYGTPYVVYLRPFRPRGRSKHRHLNFYRWNVYPEQINRHNETEAASDTESDLYATVSSSLDIKSGEDVNNYWVNPLMSGNSDAKNTFNEMSQMFSSETELEQKTDSIKQLPINGNSRSLLPADFDENDDHADMVYTDYDNYDSQYSSELNISENWSNTRRDVDYVIGGAFALLDFATNFFLTSDEASNEFDARDEVQETLKYKLNTGVSGAGVRPIRSKRESYVEQRSGRSLMLLEGGPFARQTTTASSAEEVFAAGCALRGSSFLTATDEIDMRTVNDTLASFNVSQALRQTLEQNRQTCVQFSNSIDVSQLTLPLRNELGRQLAFFDCCLRLLLSSCDTFRQQQEAIGGILANGTVNGTIDDILNSILAG